MHLVTLSEVHSLLQTWQRNETPSLLTFGKSQDKFVANSIPRLQKALQDGAITCVEMLASDGTHGKASWASEFLAEDDQAGQSALHSHDPISHLACMHALLSQVCVETACVSVPMCLETVVQVHPRRTRALFFFESLDHAFDSVLSVIKHPSEYNLSASAIAAARNFSEEQIWTSLVLGLLRDLHALHTVGFRHRNLARPGCLRLRVAPTAQFGVQLVMTEFEYAAWTLVHADDETLTFKWNKADAVIETHEGSLPDDDVSYDLCQLLIGLYETPAFRSIPIARKLGTWLRDRGVAWDCQERTIQKLTRVSHTDVVEFLRRHVSLMSVSARWALSPRFRFEGRSVVENIRRYRLPQLEQDSDGGTGSSTAAPVIPVDILTNHLPTLQWHRYHVRAAPSAMSLPGESTQEAPNPSSARGARTARKQRDAPGCVIC